MRLLKRDIGRYLQKRRSEQPSEYIGTDTGYAELGEISAIIAPVSDKAIVERFGMNADIAYSAVLDLDADIQKTDRLIVNGAECTVVEILAYKTHKTAYLSRKGI